MNDLARARRHAPEASPSEYLGPAEVKELGPCGPVVELPDGLRALAQLAFAFPYEACEGDLLLVIGRGEAHYAIGVLEGRGKAVLTFPGDVALRARGGKLELEGDQGVALRGPEVGILAGKFDVLADRIVQRCTSLYSRVKDLLAQTAGEAQTIVAGSVLTRARTSELLTEEEVTINGKQIHLG